MILRDLYVPDKDVMARDTCLSRDRGAASRYYGLTLARNGSRSGADRCVFSIFYVNCLYQAMYSNSQVDDKNFVVN